MNTKTKINPTETCESIKLGIDAHAKWYYVGRQVDGAAPQTVGPIILKLGSIGGEETTVSNSPPSRGIYL